MPGTSLSKRTIFLLLLMMVVALAFRLYRLSEPDLYVLDEITYGPAAENMVGKVTEEEARIYRVFHGQYNPMTDTGRHPPLAKYIMGISILAFGESRFALRLPSAIFGTLAVAAIFFLVRNLLWESSRRDVIALSSAFFLAFDSMMLNLSRIGMLDIYMITFTLVSIWLLSSKFRQATVLSAISFSLALLSKEQAIVTLPFILIFLWMRSRRPSSLAKFLSASALSTFLLWGLIEWVLLKPRFASIVDRLFATIRILDYVPPNLLKASAPWMWLFNLKPFSFVKYASPIHSSAMTISGPIFEPEYSIAYWLLHNPAILAFTIPTVVYFGYLAVKRKHSLHWSLMIWWLSVFLTYVLLDLVFARPSYSFYSATLILPVYIGTAYILHEKTIAPVKGGTGLWLAERIRAKLGAKPILAAIYLAIPIMFLYYYPVALT